MRQVIFRMSLNKLAGTAFFEKTREMTKFADFKN